MQHVRSHLLKKFLIFFLTFHATGLFLHPLKTRGFLMFPGVKEETTCTKWVNFKQTILYINLLILLLT